MRTTYAFLSTPSARRATGGYPGGDSICRISIHALREEGDLLHLLIQPSRPLFLSTPSARRATQAEGAGGTRPTISIHALREEGDSKNGELLRRFCLIIHDSVQF